MHWWRFDRFNYLLSNCVQPFLLHGKARHPLAWKSAAIISFLFFAPLLDEAACTPTSLLCGFGRPLSALLPPEIDLHRMDTQMKQRGEEREGREGKRIIL